MDQGYLEFLKKALGKHSRISLAPPQPATPVGATCGGRDDIYPGFFPAERTEEDIIMGFEPEPISPTQEKKNKELKELKDFIGPKCTRCPLGKLGRQQVVFGVGNSQTRLMFVGEAPGEQEDIQGVPFVGRAGQLLTKMIEAMGLSREEVYIANINKCRPPENRTPTPEEVAACSPFLMNQIDIIKPEVVVALGTTAMNNLLKTEEKITKIRGTYISLTTPKGHSVQVMPTFHPSYLLRNPSGKKFVWDDLQVVMATLGLKKSPTH